MKVLQYSVYVFVESEESLGLESQVGGMMLLTLGRVDEVLQRQRLGRVSHRLSVEVEVQGACCSKMDLVYPSTVELSQHTVEVPLYRRKREYNEYKNCSRERKRKS